MAAATSVPEPMRRRVPTILVSAVLLLGCHRGGSNAPPPLIPVPDDLPGVYAASFPCSNCTEIAATLWLRADEIFFLRQSYVGDSGTANDASYAFGHWSWDEHTAEIVLQGRGPSRRLKRLDSDRLDWLGSAPTRTTLHRDASAPAFEDRLVFDGESVVDDHGATFKQCVTGLELPIADAGALKELRRQHRVLNPAHKVALTTVDAHIVDIGAREHLVIDKVIKLKPGAGC